MSDRLYFGESEIRGGSVVRIELLTTTSVNLGVGLGWVVLRKVSDRLNAPAVYAVRKYKGNEPKKVIIRQMLCMRRWWVRMCETHGGDGRKRVMMVGRTDGCLLLTSSSNPYVLHQLDQPVFRSSSLSSFGRMSTTA